MADTFWNGSCWVLEISRQVGASYNASDSWEEDAKDCEEAWSFFPLFNCVVVGLQVLFSNFNCKWKKLLCLAI